jgi:hypothetical protein
MLWQRVNRSDPEKIFLVAKNSYTTASLGNGQPVAWDTGDADGVGVTIPPAIGITGGFTMAGVAAETIAYGSYGLIQIYGYHSSAIVRTMSTTVNGARVWHAVAEGSPLTAPLASAFALEAADTASTNFVSWPCAFAMAAQGSYTTRRTAIFIKAM